MCVYRLENALRNFACLTTGDVIAINYNEKVRVSPTRAGASHTVGADSSYTQTLSRVGRWLLSAVSLCETCSPKSCYCSVLWILSHTSVFSHKLNNSLVPFSFVGIFSLLPVLSFLDYRQS